MPDIKTLNSSVSLQLQASEKAIDPPLFAEERAIMTDLDMSASSLNVVRKLDGIKVFDTGFNLYVSEAGIDRLQKSIKDYFFYDQLMLPDPQGTPATAYEISLRYEQMQKLMGPTLGRLENDLLDPIVTRAFRLLVRNGQIPAPPDQVIAEGADFEVEYIGALSTAQRADRAASLERYGVALANLSPTMPEVLDVVDQEELARQLGRDLGVPATVLRSEEEVEDLRTPRADKQAAMEDAVIAQQQGDAINAMGAGDPTLGQQ